MAGVLNLNSNWNFETRRTRKANERTLQPSYIMTVVFAGGTKITEEGAFNIGVHMYSAKKGDRPGIDIA
jgi:hypothetical protein